MSRLTVVILVLCVTGNLGASTKKPDVTTTAAPVKKDEPTTVQNLPAGMLPQLSEFATKTAQTLAGTLLGIDLSLKAINRRIEELNQTPNMRKIMRRMDKLEKRHVCPTPKSALQKAPVQYKAYKRRIPKTYFVN